MHCYCQEKIDVGHSCTVPVCDLKFGKFPQHVFLQNHPDAANELKRQSDNFICPGEGETFILKLTTSSLAPRPSPPLPPFDSAEACALTCTFSGTKVCFVCFSFWQYTGSKPAFCFLVARSQSASSHLSCSSFKWCCRRCWSRATLDSGWKMLCMAGQ